MRTVFAPPTELSSGITSQAFIKAPVVSDDRLLVASLQWPCRKAKSTVDLQMGETIGLPTKALY